MAKQKERIKRLTLADPRSGTERLMGLVSRAISPDKGQARKYDDTPERMATNKRATQKRLDAKAGASSGVGRMNKARSGSPKIKREK